MGNLVDRVGEEYNGLVIIEELGNNEVKAKCIDYGHVNVYNKSALVNGAIKYCKTCKGEKDIKVGDIKANLEVLRVSEDKVIVRCLKCGHKEIRAKKSFKYNDDPKCSRCSINPLLVSVKGQVFKKLKVIRDTGGGVVKAKCIECGAIGEYHKGNLINKGYLCICCEKKNSGYNEDQTERVFNGSYVLEEYTDQDGKKWLKVECVDCGAIHNVLKGTIITCGFICDKCKDEYKGGICPNCKKPIKFKRTSKNCTCSFCGNKVPREVISSAIDFQYRLYKNVQKYGGSGSRVIGNVQILKYKYKGRDKLNYFDAVCLDHNKKVVLNMNEAKTNNHDLCNCDYEM